MSLFLCGSKCKNNEVTNGLIFYSDFLFSNIIQVEQVIIPCLFPNLLLPFIFDSGLILHFSTCSEFENMYGIIRYIEKCRLGLGDVLELRALAVEV